MIQPRDSGFKPEILAPAGTRPSFLAALAAGADAVYCGLKQFSARMEAKNFTLEELAPLTRLAHTRGTKVYVALNTLLKPAELNRAGGLIESLNRAVMPDALIVQDLALVELAKQAGFAGQLHLSTLANVSFAAALNLVKARLGAVSRVVIPRELNIDEIKTMTAACPQGLELEVFVHGALCYGVSGRCYWSSYLGGKSGLRGRCVQPCRRLYSHNQQTDRLFSCQDLSLDVLAKVLLTVPRVCSWKIEGRKKGPHYVFYTTKAYRMLRDHGHDPQMKKAALDLLAYALGRNGTHYQFLPQRPQNPVPADGQTGSGLFMGKIQGSPRKPFMVPRAELLQGDTLRIGYEDEPWHSVLRVGRYTPKQGRLHLKLTGRKSPAAGTPVFLLDRREKELEKMICGLESELDPVTEAKIAPSSFRASFSARPRKTRADSQLQVYRMPAPPGSRGQTGLWLSDTTVRIHSKRCDSRIWWWLDPVVWPSDEAIWKNLLKGVLLNGARNFVLNAPWQVSLFDDIKGLNLWIGPFCNLSNALAVKTAASLGFSGVIVSPELDREDYLSLPGQSPLPLGIVVSANWPLCIARTLTEGLKTGRVFASPKGEQAWVSKYGQNFWVFPTWRLDLQTKVNEFKQAGYSLLVHLWEPVPRQVKLKQRPGLWNWDLKLR